MYKCKNNFKTTHALMIKNKKHTKEIYGFSLSGSIRYITRVMSLMIENKSQSNRKIDKRKKSRCIFAPNPKAKIMCELCVEFRSVCSLLPPATKKQETDTIVNSKEN